MNMVGGHGDGLQAGGAEAVDGDARRGHRHAGQQGHLTADIRRGVGIVAHVAVFDEVELDARARHGVLHRMGPKRHGGSDIEPAPTRLGQARTGIGYDNGFAHVASSLLRQIRGRSTGLAIADLVRPVR